MGIYSHPTQASHYSSKTSRYDLYKCGTAVKIHGTAATPRNSTGHLTENAITFYSELRFQ